LEKNDLRPKNRLGGPVRLAGHGFACTSRSAQLAGIRGGSELAATDYFTSRKTTWGDLMFRLKAAGEGRGTGPLFLRGGLAY